MLNNLTQRFVEIIKTIRGETHFTEANIAHILREVRLALLEADVALSVVRDFIKSVKEKAIGEKVINSLTPNQALISVVQDELANLMGANLSCKDLELNFSTQPPAIILLVGLQGSGKTTTVGKLVKYLLKHDKKKILTVSLDVYRPAAMDQLRTVTKQAGADFFVSQSINNPIKIALFGLDYARKNFYEVFIIDTAGRLGIDESMMKEISAVHSLLKPIETLFVIDSMLGQDAINIAKCFNTTLPITGIVLTKLDGDSRGGAALSVRYVVGKPIKFVGIGETLDGLESFNPMRMVNRILGMGDILGLIEEVRKNNDIIVARNFSDKTKQSKKFDLNDFKLHLRQVAHMGGLSNIIDKLPAHLQQSTSMSNVYDAEKQVRRIEGMINAMTIHERISPELIKASRKRRIARGAGVSVQEVNRMLIQFVQIQSMMKQMKGKNIIKIISGIKNLFSKIH